MPSCPPNHPKCCCVSPESPSWHAGFAGSSGGLLQPLEREKPDKDTCPSCSAWLRSPGCRHRPSACPGKGWDWAPAGSTILVLWISLQHGLFFFHPSNTCWPEQQNWWEMFVGLCPREGRKMCWRVHLTLAGFHLFAVANIGPGRESSGTLGSPFPAGPGLPEADGDLTVQLLRGERRGCHPGGHFGLSLISHERLQADENYS